MPTRTWEIRWFCDGQYRVDTVEAVDLLEAVEAVKQKVMGGADFEHRFFSAVSLSEGR